MTIDELSQLCHLNREIEMDQSRLREFESQALPGAQRLSEMPGGTGICDVVGDCAAEIADLRGIIADKQRRCLSERARLERYISGIDDSALRQIFTYRFVDGLSWKNVAMHVGGGNTADSVRKKVKRYLKH